MASAFVYKNTGGPVKSGVKNEELRRAGSGVLKAPVSSLVEMPLPAAGSRTTEQRHMQLAMHRRVSTVFDSFITSCTHFFWGEAGQDAQDRRARRAGGAVLFAAAFTAAASKSPNSSPRSGMFLFLFLLAVFVFVLAAFALVDCLGRMYRVYNSQPATARVMQTHARRAIDFHPGPPFVTSPLGMG